MSALAHAGIGRLVLITGPAGVGKTRQAEILRDAARRDGTTVIWAVAGRPGAPAFWPWTQALAALQEEVRAGHPFAAGLLDDRLDEPAGRFALFDDLAATLADAGRANPVLLVLDDLHEADAASLLVLAHLAPLLRTMPVVVAATVRTDVEPGRVEWAAVWADLLRQADVVTVGPLSTDEVARLLRANGARADAGVVARVMQRTGGNALFVCELVRLLGTVPDVEAIPDTLRAVVAARLAPRTAACRRVLSAGAVIGARLPTRLLVAVVGEATDDVETAIDEAERHGLLRRPAAGEIVFAHEIVCDVVRDLLPAAHRAHWHASVARQAALAGTPADAALHFRLAGEHGEAAGWAARAGRDSLAKLAYEDAAAHFRAALGGSAQPGPVHVLLADAALGLGAG
ncbi:MAG: ATP-binding protein, partial [Jatrophihabitantaceae bacterium]